MRGGGGLSWLGNMHRTWEVLQVRFFLLSLLSKCWIQRLVLRMRWRAYALYAPGVAYARLRPHVRDWGGGGGSGVLVLVVVVVGWHDNILERSQQVLIMT